MNSYLQEHSGRFLGIFPTAKAKLPALLHLKIDKGHWPSIRRRSGFVAIVTSVWLVLIPVAWLQAITEDLGSTFDMLLALSPLSFPRGPGWV